MTFVSWTKLLYSFIIASFNSKFISDFIQRDCGGLQNIPRILGQDIISLQATHFDNPFVFGHPGPRKDHSPNGLFSLEATGYQPHKLPRETLWWEQHLKGLEVNRKCFDASNPNSFPTCPKARVWQQPVTSTTKQTFSWLGGLSSLDNTG